MSDNFWDIATIILFRLLMLDKRILDGSFWRQFIISWLLALDDLALPEINVCPSNGNTRWTLSNAPESYSRNSSNETHLDF